MCSCRVSDVMLPIVTLYVCSMAAIVSLTILVLCRIEMLSRAQKS